MEIIYDFQESCSGAKVWKVCLNFRTEKTWKSKNNKFRVPNRSIFINKRLILEWKLKRRQR